MKSEVSSSLTHMHVGCVCIQLVLPDTVLS